MMTKTNIPASLQVRTFGFDSQMNKLLGVFLVALIMTFLVACSIKADQAAVADFLKKLNDNPDIAVYLSGEPNIEVNSSREVGDQKLFEYWVRVAVTDTFEKLTNDEKYKILMKATNEVASPISSFGCGKNAHCSIDKLIFIYEDKNVKISKNYSLSYGTMHIGTIEEGKGPQGITSEDYNPTPESVTLVKKPQVDVGMTADKITSILGEPDEILNTESDSLGDVCYRWFYEGRGYIYFADHKAWQILFND